MLKRLFDITFGIIGLVISLPILLLITVAIFAEDGGVILFRQRRYGLGERPFWLLKFRTMRIIPKIENRRIEDLKHDNRVTRVGRLLRVSFLDELPQLINIIMGDMSIVGPRPIPCDMYVDDIDNWHCRSTIRPGLTGMAQVHCTKYTTLRNKFRFDALYVKKASLCLDIKLIIATFWKINRLAAFVACTVMILLATWLPIPESSIPTINVIVGLDKLAHFGMFALMALSAIWLFRKLLGDTKQEVFFTNVWCATLAGITEFVQFFLPLRNMSFWDFCTDMVGVGLICGFYCFWHGRQ